jgi:hypothetical protein
MHTVYLVNNLPESWRNLYMYIPLVVKGGGRDHWGVYRTYIHTMTAGGFLNLLTVGVIIAILALI